MTPEEAKKLYEKYGSAKKASEITGIPRTTFRRRLKQAGVNPDNTSLETDFKHDEGVITTKSLNISTVDQALKYSKVDQSIWEVQRHVITSNEITMGSKKSGTGKPETYTNYSVKIWLRRKKPQELSLDKLISKLNRKSIKTECKRPPKGEIMMVPGLVDHHFGMLAWDKETREGDYDLKIAENLYINAINEGIDNLASQEIAKILIPVGSDFFHINDQTNSTPKSNNPLDVDSRLIKVFETGQYAVIKAIERCKQVAPVKITWVPGNHDLQTSYYLCKVIEAYYSNDENVEVDVGPTLRKFEKWGKVLLGLTHGSEEPIKDLPRIMADSCSSWWGQCDYKEWLIGHIHKKKQMDFISVDSFGRTVVRFLPSLCKTDAWHYSKGYVGNERVAEILAYDKNGLKAYFPVKNP